MSTASIGAVGQQGAQNPTGKNAFDELNLDEFLGLMIAELQNQDPLNPMDNVQILQQMSQIREIESNTRLTSTLESVLMGQNLTTAGSLLGKNVVAISEAGERVVGKVDRVSIGPDDVKVHVGTRSVDLKNVSEILPEDVDIQEEPLAA